MSADLLRRAAKTLRGHAEAATAGPWNASAVDSPDAVVTSAVYSFAHPTGTPESEVIGASRKARGGGIRTGRDARYIALVHPPVALALAAWLEETAREIESHAENFTEGVERFDDLTSVDEVAHQVARAILREES